MDAQSRKRLEWMPTVIGVLISCGIGAFFYFRTDLKAAFATFAGLLGTAIALQIELIVQTRGGVEARARQEQLLASIESVGWLPEVLGEMLPAASHVELTYGDTMAPRLVREAFEDCLSRVRDLHRGHYEAPYDDILLMYSLLERTHVNMLATSVSGDLPWWHTPHGETYLRMHREAIGRGVLIQRIFIFEDWDETHERMAQLLYECGVKVRRARRRELPPVLRLDMIIWDRKVGYETRLNSVGEPTANHYTFAEQDVSLMLNQFRLIESCSQPWEPGATNSTADASL